MNSCLTPYDFTALPNFTEICCEPYSSQNKLEQSFFFETNALVDAEIAPSVTVLSQMNIKTHPHVNAQVYSTSKTTCLDCIKCTSCLPYDGHLSIRDHVTGKTAPMQYEEFLDLLQKQTSDIPYTLINSSLLISRRPQIML